MAGASSVVAVAVAAAAYAILAADDLSLHLRHFGEPAVFAELATVGQLARQLAAPESYLMKAISQGLF